MQVEHYFQQIREIIESSPFIQLSDISYNKRSSYEGYIRGEVLFVDGSVLHLREFVDVEIESERLMYVYQYQDSENKLIFRYDDTGHHKRLKLQTFPHHKHQGSEENVIASDAPTLSQVLEEIELSLQLP